MTARKPKAPWTQEHTDTLRRMATAGYTNAQIVADIRAKTGHRFSVFTVCRRRAAMGLPRAKPVGYNGALRRWRMIEQGA